MSIAPTLKKLLEISWFFNGASRLEEELEPSVYPILHDKWVKRDFSHFEAPDYGTTRAWLPSKIYVKNGAFKLRILILHPKNWPSTLCKRGA